MITVRIKNTIPSNRFDVNDSRSSILRNGVKLGPTKDVKKYAAEKLIHRPENALRYGRYFFFFINLILTSFNERLVGGKIK